MDEMMVFLHGVKPDLEYLWAENRWRLGYLVENRMKKYDS
jgi:hypothetical protein